MIAGVFAVIVIAAAVFSTRRPPPPPAPALPPARALPQAAIISPSPPAVTRNEIVQNALVNAGAYAAGLAPSTSKSPLLGRTFELRIPFGCNGPGGDSAASQAYVELDPKSGALKLVARPADWSTLPIVQAEPSAKSIESVEGFWIPRPWLNSETCPPRRDRTLPATPTPAAAQTIGLAQIFETGASRVVARGNRPYETVLKPEKARAAPLERSFKLVLQGRLVGFGDGRVAHCWSESDDHRPICLYSVVYDRVAFEDGQTGETVAEWKDQ